LDSFLSVKILGLLAFTLPGIKRGCQFVLISVVEFFLAGIRMQIAEWLWWPGSMAKGDGDRIATGIEPARPRERAED
jgi:hypothetical protein